MIVVSNTSPIFYLSTIGQLDLLRQLYNEVVIPKAVFNETVSGLRNSFIQRFCKRLVSQYEGKTSAF
jgi:predicted nucleic acid-binding protein